MKKSLSKLHKTIYYINGAKLNNSNYINTRPSKRYSSPLYLYMFMHKKKVIKHAF